MFGTGTRVPEEKIPDPGTRIDTRVPGSLMLQESFFRNLQKSDEEFIITAKFAVLSIFSIQFFSVLCQISANMHCILSYLPPLLALRYLGIPGTSTPSEKLFSKAGEIVCSRRSSLTIDCGYVGFSVKKPAGSRLPMSGLSLSDPHLTTASGKWLWGLL